MTTTAYGVPFGLPGGDTDSDGDCDSTDVTQIQSWIDGSTYDVRGDMDLDGDVDATDKSTVQSEFEGLILGRAMLSASDGLLGLSGANLMRAGPCAYEFRNRNLNCHIGAWMRRDPAEYTDSMGLYVYATSSPLVYRDSHGLSAHDPKCEGECNDASVATCTIWVKYAKPGGAVEGKGCTLDKTNITADNRMSTACRNAARQRWCEEKRCPEDVEDCFCHYYDTFTLDGTKKFGGPNDPDSPTADVPCKGGREVKVRVRCKVDITANYRIGSCCDHPTCSPLLGVGDD